MDMKDYTSIDFSRAALLIIDLQRDFAIREGAAYIAGTQKIIPMVREMAMAFRRAGLPIVHVIRLYMDDGSNVDRCRRHLFKDGCGIVSPGSYGANIVPMVLPEVFSMPKDGELLQGGVHPICHSDHVMYKSRWGSFYGTVLEDWLKARGVDSLLVAGCNFPNCPRTTLYEASERDFRLAIVPGALSGIYPRAIKELEGIGVNMYTLEGLNHLLLG